MPYSADDLTGCVFGELTVERRGPNEVFRSSATQPRWYCRCSCGARRLVRGANLVEGRTRACGHLRKTRKPVVTARPRGMSPEYVAWTNMRQRCNNPSHPHYGDYGGRGIRVCERWNSFENFLADVGFRPHPALSLGRQDSNGDYTPENTVWRTRYDQTHNKRRVRRVTWQGRTMCLAEWARFLNVPVDTFTARLRRYGLCDRTFAASVS